MRMKLWMATIVVAFILGLAGCVPTHFDEDHAKLDPTKSKAMNIALLTGLTHAERGPLKDSEPVSGSKDSGMSGAAMSNLAAGGVDLLSGGGGLGVVTSFMFKTYQPEWENHVFAWLPEGMAKDEADAASVMCNIMQSAIKKLGVKGTTLFKEESCSTFAAFSDAQRTRFFFKGDKNKDVTALVAIVAVPNLVSQSFLAPSPSYFWSYMKTNSDTSPVLGFGRWTSDTYGIKSEYPDAPIVEESVYEKKKALNDLYARISPLLPEWVYLYVAPDLKAGEPAFFLNHGKKLYFVKPS